jgi:hypothetical protein
MIVCDAWCVRCHQQFSIFTLQSSIFNLQSSISFVPPRRGRVRDPTHKDIGDLCWAGLPSFGRAKPVPPPPGSGRRPDLQGPRQSLCRVGLPSFARAKSVPPPPGSDRRPDLQGPRQSLCRAGLPSFGRAKPVPPPPGSGRRPDLQGPRQSLCRVGLPSFGRAKPVPPRQGRVGPSAPPGRTDIQNSEFRVQNSEFDCHCPNLFSAPWRCLGAFAVCFQPAWRRVQRKPRRRGKSSQAPPCFHTLPTKSPGSGTGAGSRR